MDKEGYALAYLWTAGAVWLMGYESDPGDKEGHAMPTYLYWRHKQSGEIYAVCMDDAGVLDGAVEARSDKEISTLE